MTSYRPARYLLALALILCVVLPLNSCGGGAGAGDAIFLPTFSPVQTTDGVVVTQTSALTPAEITFIMNRAARAIDTPGLIIAVVDRVGRPLGIWSRLTQAQLMAQAPAGSGLDDVNKAVSIARTGAFMSSSQGPITTRTLEFISTFHFPSVFGDLTTQPIPNNAFTLDPSLPLQHVTTAVAQTPQGPLWQIFSSNRGAPYAGQDLTNSGIVLGDGNGNTTYSPPVNNLFLDQRIPAPGRVNFDGTLIPNVPGTGLSYLAGGVPIYKLGQGAAPGARVVGGIGVYATDAAGVPLPDAAEFAAIRGLGGIDENGNNKPENTFAQPADIIGGPNEDLNFFFPFSIVPPAGRIFLVGITLPYVKQPVRPAGINAIPMAAPLVGETLMASTTGGEQPWGWIIGPMADPDPEPNGLTQADVERIIGQGIATADGTRAAIRVPAGSATKMVFAVTNRRGRILGAYRMEDAPIFSYDVSLSKARCVTYLSSYPGGLPDMAPQDAQLLNNAGFPTGLAGTPGEFGVAITTRTLAFATQPFFPPGIDTAQTQPGPLFALAAQNADPNQFNRMANASTLNAEGLQSGVIFFPGASPLYKNGVLAGGFGVSGDGVEQDDFVTNGGFTGFEPPAAIRADQFLFEGIRYPFFKFPQFPGPGADLSSFGR